MPLSRLDGPRRPPREGGKARQVVVLLHGVGADGEDLIPLADVFAEALPQAAFVAPNAPEPCDMAPLGRQWFSLQERTPARLLAGIQATAPVLNAFLDSELARHGLNDGALALVGFSQGTMMALYAAPRRPRPCAGIVGFSGALFGGEALAGEAQSRPPVLLIHGTDDEVVPFGAMRQAADGLGAADFAVETEARDSLGHGIDPEGIERAAAFLGRIFETG